MSTLFHDALFSPILFVTASSAYPHKRTICGWGHLDADTIVISSTPPFALCNLNKSTGLPTPEFRCSCKDPFRNNPINDITSTRCHSCVLISLQSTTIFTTTSLPRPFHTHSCTLAQTGMNNLSFPLLFATFLHVHPSPSHPRHAMFPIKANVNALLAHSASTLAPPCLSALYCDTTAPQLHATSICSQSSPGTKTLPPFHVAHYSSEIMLLLLLHTCADIFTRVGPSSTCYNTLTLHLPSSVHWLVVIANNTSLSRRQVD